MLPLLRFTLDLFEQNRPPAQVDKAQPAIDLIAFDRSKDDAGAAATVADGDVTKEPSQFKAPLRQPLPPSVLQPSPPPLAPLRHPRASHEVRLGEVLVGYEFKRSQRRSIRQPDL